MSNSAPSLISAARAARPAPSHAEVAAAERRILAEADPAAEAPASLTTIPTATLEPANVLDRIAARKPPKIQLTPLHVNIPVTLDRALSRAMREKGIEKTAIVVEALRPILEAYL